MLQPDANQRLTQRGPASAGRWTPESWKAELQDKVESNLLAAALTEAVGEYSEQFREPPKAVPKVKAMPKLKPIRYRILLGQIV
jgi:hypothetical protein